SANLCVLCGEFRIQISLAFASRRTSYHRAHMRFCRRLTLVLTVALLFSGAARGADGTGPGRYTVGVTSLTFTKDSVTTGAPRPLITTIWYPAVAGTGSDDPLGRRDADVFAKRFPLIVFSHGACGLPTEATYLTTALASRGFVVAAPAHLGNTKD